MSESHFQSLYWEGDEELYFQYCTRAKGDKYPIVYINRNPFNCSSNLLLDSNPTGSTANFNNTNNTNTNVILCTLKSKGIKIIFHRKF